MCVRVCKSDDETKNFFSFAMRREKEILGVDSSFSLSALQKKQKKRKKKSQKKKKKKKKKNDERNENLLKHIITNK